MSREGSYAKGKAKREEILDAALDVVARYGGELACALRRLKLDRIPEELARLNEDLQQRSHDLENALAARLQRRDHGILTPLSRQISAWQQEGDRIILCCRSARHLNNLRDLLTRHHHQTAEVTPPVYLDDSAIGSSDNPVLLCHHPLNEGFSIPDLKTHLLSEIELFGEMRLFDEFQRVLQSTRQ